MMMADKRSVQVLFVLVALAAALQAAHAAKILAMSPISIRSHHIIFAGVTKLLADRGHEVTYISGMDKGHKIHPTNNKIVPIGNAFAAALKTELKNFYEDEKTPLESLTFLMEWGLQLVNKTMSNPLYLTEVKGQKYDLIMVEAFFFQEAFVALGHQFNAPVVAVHPFGLAQWVNEAIGNPVNPAWVPSLFLGYSDHMSFSERAYNAYTFLATHYKYHYQYLHKQRSLVSQYWPDAPSLDELIQTRVALVLANSHFTLGYPVPLAPSVVEIGGLHIRDKVKPLPQDLQTFMDSAKEGVVFFSMGSNLRAQDMPDEKKKAVLDALGALKERVLIKWDGPTPKDMAKNIRTTEWAPQADLLAHPNLRLFVTHGGLHSTQESAYHGVPLVGIPILGDQKFNMLLAVNKGFCIQVEFKTMTQAVLSAALKEVLENPKYKAAATRLSRLFRSKPLQPGEAAVLAVEQVLQHGGEHLRPASVGMPIHQLLLLDLVLVAILAALVPVTAIALLCRCRRRLRGQADESKKKD